jgi:hypothetical protein
MHNNEHSQDDLSSPTECRRTEAFLIGRLFYLHWPVGKAAAFVKSGDGAQEELKVTILLPSEAGLVV